MTAHKNITISKLTANFPSTRTDTLLVISSLHITFEYQKHLTLKRRRHEGLPVGDVTAGAGGGAVRGLRGAGLLHGQGQQVHDERRARDAEQQDDVLLRRDVHRSRRLLRRPQTRLYR